MHPASARAYIAAAKTDREREKRTARVWRQDKTHMTRTFAEYHNQQLEAEMEFHMMLAKARAETWKELAVMQRRPGIFHKLGAMFS